MVTTLKRLAQLLGRLGLDIATFFSVFVLAVVLPLYLRVAPHPDQIRWIGMPWGGNRVDWSILVGTRHFEFARTALTTQPGGFISSLYLGWLWEMDCEWVPPLTPAPATMDGAHSLFGLGFRHSEMTQFAADDPQSRLVRPVLDCRVNVPFWIAALCAVLLPTWRALKARRAFGRKLRQLLRRLTTYGLVASSVLVIVFWLRSQWRNDWLDVSISGLGENCEVVRVMEIVSNTGRVGVCDVRTEPSADLAAKAININFRIEGEPVDPRYPRRAPAQTWLDRLGFSWSRYAACRLSDVRLQMPWSRYYSDREATVPYWFLSIPAIIFGNRLVRTTWRWRTHRLRRQAGLCNFCGYDLRGGHERCPECGTATVSPIAREPIDRSEGRTQGSPLR